MYYRCISFYASGFVVLFRFLLFNSGTESSKELHQFTRLWQHMSIVHPIIIIIIMINVRITQRNTTTPKTRVLDSSICTYIHNMKLNISPNKIIDFIEKETHLNGPIKHKMKYSFFQFFSEC